MSNNNSFTTEEIKLLNLGGYVAEVGIDNIAARTRLGDVPVELNLSEGHREYTSKVNSTLLLCDDLNDVGCNMMMIYSPISTPERVYLSAERTIDSKLGFR